MAANESPRAFVYEISWDPHESASFTKRTEAELYRELHAGLGTNEANSQGDNLLGEKCKPNVNRRPFAEPLRALQYAAACRGLYLQSALPHPNPAVPPSHPGGWGGWGQGGLQCISGLIWRRSFHAATGGNISCAPTNSTRVDISCGTRPGAQKYIDRYIDRSNKARVNPRDHPVNIKTRSLANNVTKVLFLLLFCFGVFFANLRQILYFSVSRFRQIVRW